LIKAKCDKIPPHVLFKRFEGLLISFDRTGFRERGRGIKGKNITTTGEGELEAHMSLYRSPDITKSS